MGPGLILARSNNESSIRTQIDNCNMFLLSKNVIALNYVDISGKKINPTILAQWKSNYNVLVVNSVADILDTTDELFEFIVMLRESRINLMSVEEPSININRLYAPIPKGNRKIRQSKYPPEVRQRIAYLHGRGNSLRAIARQINKEFEFYISHVSVFKILKTVSQDEIEQAFRNPDHIGKGI